MATRIFENSMQMNENLHAGGGKKLLEAKMSQGPVLRRAALGDIRNKPNIIKPAKNDDGNFKKAAAYVQQRGLKLRNKENVPGICAKKVEPKPLPKPEVMEVEESLCVDDLSTAFSSKMLGVLDIDAEDADNPQLVSVYVNDIYKYLWELEDNHLVNQNYLEGQIITGRMRGVLIDWLVQVHLRFTLLQETLYLTVAIIDRYLQAEPTIKKDRLQLVGVTAMFIACKYEELYLPELGDFAYITDKAFSKRDIMRMEVVMLNHLNFNLSFPLPLHFLRRNSKAGQVDAAQHTLAKYLMEITLPDYHFCHCKPSLIAAAALYLSMMLIGDVPVWDQTLAFYSHYREKDILPLVCKLAALVIKNLNSKFQAVRSKYKSAKLMKISDIPELKPTSKVLRSLAEKSTLTS